MTITIREVAKAADVSVGTVSRVLNGHATVTPAHVDRVKQAARELNYKPLRKRSQPDEDAMLKGKNIALVLLGMDRSLETLPVVATAIHGIETAVASAGGQLLLMDMPDLREGSSVIRTAQIDGVILKGALQGNAIARARDTLMDRLRHRPSVWVFGRPTGCEKWGDLVASDEWAIGQIAARRLIDQGHRRLAVINPKPDHVLLGRRQTSFIEHAKQYGASVETFTGSPTGKWELPLKPAREVESVQSLVDQLLESEPRPTAVFTPGDSIAALVYRALAARGRQVGDGISLISCNFEQPLITGLYPDLMTIDVHAARVGRRAVEQLVWRLKHPDEPLVSIGLEPTLVEGGSVESLDGARESHA